MLFGFDDKRNQCIHDGVCVYVCVRVCAEPALCLTKGFACAVFVRVCVCDTLLINTISQEGKLRQFSNLVHRCPLLRRRTLLFLVGVKGHLRSGGSNAENPRYLKLGNLDQVHTWCVGALWWEIPYRFGWRSKVI